jgi:hypothetical protein
MQAPEDAPWGGTGDVLRTWVRLKAHNARLEPSVPGSTGGLGCPLWARSSPFDLFAQDFLVDPPPYSPAQDFPVGCYLKLEVTNSYHLSPWEFVSNPNDAFDVSPISSNTGTALEPVAPSLPDATSAGVPPDAFSVNISPTEQGDEIPYHPPPRSTHNTLGKARPIRRQATRKITINTAHCQPSLRERFEDVMTIVRQLPLGEMPKNALFTSFFTRIDDDYVCLLCPASDAKVLSNRTQMIQHVAGGHGGSRPFACQIWYLVHPIGFAFSLIPA